MILSVAVCRCTTDSQTCRSRPAEVHSEAECRAKARHPQSPQDPVDQMLMLDMRMTVMWSGRQISLQLPPLLFS
jgi:hypothetical protein